MLKVKSLAFKLGLIGQGIVQNNGKGNQYLNNRCQNYYSEKATDKNVVYAKYNYNIVGKNQSDDGKEYDVIARNLKISSDGLRHAIHIKEHPIQIPATVLENNKAARIKYLSNLGAIERGYMLPNGGKRKSAYAITSAVEISGALPALEVCSSSGQRDDTSFFMKEQVGKTEYIAEGFIDLNELGFISMSRLHDRLAINEGDETEFRCELGKNLNVAYAKLKTKGYRLPELDKDVPKPNYFLKSTEQALNISEKGIYLKSSQIVLLAYDLLDKMLGINIVKSQSGYARTRSLKVKMVSDIFADLTTEDGYKDFNKTFVLDEIEQSYVVDAEGETKVTAFEKALKEGEAKSKKTRDKAQKEVEV
jgi:hypothetical protein